MLDLTKPITTRDGKPARVLCTDFNGGRPYKDRTLFIAYMTPDGEKCRALYASGLYILNKESHEDLINPPEPLPTMWINFYRYANGDIHAGVAYETREDANTAPMIGRYERVACLEIKGNIGDGLPPAENEDEEE